MKKVSSLAADNSPRDYKRKHFEPVVRGKHKHGATKAGISHGIDSICAKNMTSDLTRRKKLHGR